MTAFEQVGGCSSRRRRYLYTSRRLLHLYTFPPLAFHIAEIPAHFSVAQVTVWRLALDIARNATQDSWN